MTRTRNSSTTRRTLLSIIGTGVATGLGGTNVVAREQSNSEYVLVQGDKCVPVQPLRGQGPVEAFYDYRLPQQYVSDENGASTGDGTAYSSVGTTDLQLARTSIAFLYQGPEQLSLVVVHGSVEASDGGSVTFRLSGLPEQGAWVVKDDLYRDPDSGDPKSYDRWQVDGTDHTIDWTWGSGGTDGGAYAGLGGDFSVTIDPAFNDAAAFHGQYYEGTVTDWQFLSGSNGASERVSLDLGEPIQITTGECGDAGGEAESSDGGTNEIVFESVTDEQFAYRVTVSGEIRPDQWTDPNDVIVNGTTARGWCRSGGVDDYLFTGEIEDLALKGPGKVFVNGELLRDTS